MLYKYVYDISKYIRVRRKEFETNAHDARAYFISKNYLAPVKYACIKKTKYTKAGDFT